MDRPVAVTLLAILMLVAYLPTRTAGFVYEDHDAAPLTSADPSRPSIRAPWQGWSVESQHLAFRPRALTNLTMRLQAWADADAAGYHALNVGVHLLNGLLLYALLAPITGAGALLTVLLFWLHPINGEAVRYVSARTDLLVVLAVLLTLCAATRPTWPRVALVTLLGALAPWAKESGVVIVGLLPLWLWFVGRWERRWLIPIGIWSLAGLSVAYRLLHISATAGAPPWSALAHYTAPAAPGFLALQSAALWRLLALIVWPVGFSIDHDIDAVPIALGLCALLGIVIAGRLAWTSRMARFAALWLLTVLSLRFLIPQPEFLHEQHGYSALLGVWIALGFGLTQLRAPRTLASWRERMVHG